MLPIVVVVHEFIPNNVQSTLGYLVVVVVVVVVVTSSYAVE
jgi:hypothetical protein